MPATRTAATRSRPASSSDLNSTQRRQDLAFRSAVDLRKAQGRAPSTVTAQGAANSSRHFLVHVIRVESYGGPYGLGWFILVPTIVLVDDQYRHQFNFSSSATLSR